MSWRITIRTAASEDLREARDWYETARTGLGDEFLLEIADAFSRLEESPERFPFYYKGFRRLLMPHFPYRLFYRIEGNDVLVFRILHAAREHRSLLK